jgi:hypothetical protein
VNLRFNQDIETTLKRLADDILPDFAEYKEKKLCKKPFLLRGRPTASG